MDWLENLYTIAQIILIPLLGFATTKLIAWINTKAIETQKRIDNTVADKYIGMVAQTIQDCVIATNQTYVEALKKDNMFTEEAQKKAFQKTYDAVVAILSNDVKEYLETLYGDAAVYLTTRIEAEVNLQK